MISDYRENRTYSDISSEDDELSCRSSVSDKQERQARNERAVSEQIKEEIRLFTEQLLSKREEQFLACLKRVDKSLQGIHLNLRPAADKKEAGQPAVTTSTAKGAAASSKTTSRLDYHSYKGLPIPLLTPERDYQKWFGLYEQVMATKDERILKHALVYYLDEDVVDLWLELSQKSYRNLKKTLHQKIKDLEFYDG